MSSHHFVKENQEPALLILEPDAIPFERIQELLEWCPTVMVGGRAVDKVMGWGVKLDVVFTEPEYLESLKEKLIEQAPVKLISADQLAVTAFRFLLASQQFYVNLISGSPAIFSMALPFSPPLQVVVLNAQGRWSLVNSRRFEKWMQAGSSIQIADSTGRITQHLTAKESGVMKIERPDSFWIGELTDA